MKQILNDFLITFSFSGVCLLRPATVIRKQILDIQTRVISRESISTKKPNHLRNLTNSVVDLILESLSHIPVFISESDCIGACEDINISLYIDLVQY